MPNVMTGNIPYVKFVRGTTAAWTALQNTPEKINDDTLYFIYDNNQTADGKLYLGQKLISSNGSNPSGVISLDDIGDIFIDDITLANKQILVYNEASGQWENTSLETIIDTAVGVMQGATSVAAGVAGLVPRPSAGDQTKFLRGDGSWATLNIPTFDTKVFSLNNNEISLKDYGLAAVGSIPIKTNNGIEWSTNFIGKLDRQITTLEKLQAQLNGTDPDPLSTDTIYMVTNGNNSSSNNQYDEYMIINNHLERLGTFGQVDLTNYVQVTTFETAINSLNSILQDSVNDETEENIPGLISRVNTIELNYITKSQIGDLNQLLLSDGNNNLVDEVNTLHTGLSQLDERLKWHELQSNN